MKIVSQYAVARLCNVSRTAIYKAVKSGRCPAVLVRKVKKIDLHDPAVKQFIEKTMTLAQAREADGLKYHSTTHPTLPVLVEQKRRAEQGDAALPTNIDATDAPVVPTVPRRVVPPVSPQPPMALEVEPFVPLPPPPPPLPEVEEWRPEFDPVEVLRTDVKLRKALADAELQEVRLRKESELYLERMGAIVDLETLRRKMAQFADVLVTQLVYLPEGVADQLWIQAKAADDPPKKIREFLAHRLAAVIQSAKQAAAEVAPPSDGRRYLIADVEPSSD